MKRRSTRTVGIAAGICILLVTTACSSPSSAGIQSAQETVDAVSHLQALPIPDHLLEGQATREEADLDVNSYFDVLDHLSMEPGYVLDYLYMKTDLGGHPFVYARPAERAPYASYEEYASDTGLDEQEAEYYAEYSDDYLSHVRVDDTPEGYFQFVVLRIKSDDFYLFWHAAASRSAIVCNDVARDRLLSNLEGSLGIDDLRAGARNIDFTPTVELLDDATALVRLVTFGEFSGFVENRYSVGREFPHQILSVERNLLIEYDPGYVY